MKRSLNVLITGAWHPKSGFEEAFVRLWNEKIHKLAYDMGGSRAGLYHNEETDVYLSSILFPSKEAAERFLSSEKFAKATHDLNQLCLIPIRKEFYDILPEAM